MVIMRRPKSDPDSSIYQTTGKRCSVVLECGARVTAINTNLSQIIAAVIQSSSSNCFHAELCNRRNVIAAVFDP